MIKLPIRHLVEFIMRSGDINSRYVSKDRMVEGAKAHRILQKKYRGLYEDYRNEVAVPKSYYYNDIEQIIEGHANGIFNHNGRYTNSQHRNCGFFP